ncbi:MAG: sugar transferase [Bacteroidales bacterium]|jgi:lipopolysaccharide/colanic/teichoic acid biosynthesis glycosyltransferase
MNDQIPSATDSEKILGGHSVTFYNWIKCISDYLFSVLFLILLSPGIIILIIVIRFSGKGPIIYKQDRVGKDGKPFSIYKFRSMVYDAEKEEPLLSRSKEERVTATGRFLRKYRIDEIPNLINVLKGEMSIVGPRPERSFFINQIIKSVPQYTELQRVKPGVTSWGQVKYGYASNVKEMIERLDYDLYYMKNRSLWLDIKIAFFTISTILKGKGM